MRYLVLVRKPDGSEVRDYAEGNTKRAALAAAQGLARSYELETPGSTSTIRRAKERVEEEVHQRSLVDIERERQYGDAGPWRSE